MWFLVKKKRELYNHSKNATSIENYENNLYKMFVCRKLIRDAHRVKCHLKFVSTILIIIVVVVG